jgi:hypothetical protein
MLGNLLSLQFGGFYGGNIGSILASWEQAGVFSYVLPFLLIFSIVFGILMKTQIFKDNKGLNGVIALVIGLLAMQFDLVPIFFSQIFPRVGIALSIILVLLILVGLFFDPNNKFVGYGLLGVGVIIFLVVLTKTAGSLGWYSFDWWFANWQTILGYGAIIAIIFGIINSVGPKPNIPDYRPVLFGPK